MIKVGNVLFVKIKNLIENIKFKFEFFKKNWKLGVHLLLGTYKFGVNNKWWSDFPSIFGIPFYKRTPRRILINYRGMRFRVSACYFLDKETGRKLFPRYYKKYKN